MKKAKHWYDYLWIVTPVYLALGFFNILFAWLGMIFFCLPLFIAIFGGSKLYCNRYCDRGQFLSLLGGRLKLSANRPTPNWMRSKWFRYGFSGLFLCHVLSNALDHLSGGLRGTESERDGQAVLDLPPALGLGVSRGSSGSQGGAVCLRLLQPDAHLQPDWLDRDGPV